MSDDSYFGDELVLDDELIAALDAEEEKYVHTQPVVAEPAFVRHTPPPAKKQKIRHEITVQRPVAADEYVDLPEISIEGDGTYGVSAGSVSAGSSIVKPNSGNIRAPSGLLSSRGLNPVSSDSSSSARRPQPTAQRSLGAHATGKPSQVTNAHQKSRPPPQSQRSRSSLGTPAYPVLSQGQVEQRTELSDLRDRVENTRQPVRRILSNVSVTRVSHPPANVSLHTVNEPGYVASQRLNASQSRTSMTSQEKAQQSLLTEVNILRTQVEELSKKGADARREAEEARNARLAKEGEVSILRVNIEKINKQHAAELQRLRAAKESTEEMLVQVHQSTREEMDRLRAELTFKQHESETSVRRSPLAVRASKSTHPVAPPMGTQKNPRSHTLPLSSQAPTVDETPRKPTVAPGSPQRRRIRSLGAQEKFSAFPGFQSGFESTPVIVKGKGKQREIHPSDDDIFVAPAAPWTSPPSSPTRPPARAGNEIATGDVAMADAMPFPSADLLRAPGLSSQPASNPDGDVEMSDNALPKEPAKPTPDSAVEVEPPNWKHELHHIMFSHHSRSDSSQLTLLLVMNTTLSEIDPEQSSLFTSNAHRLLETLGTSYTSADWTTHLSTISSSLVVMTHCLAVCSSFTPLVAMLNLIRTLTYSIPSFTSSLLSPLSNTDDESPQVLVVLHDIILRHLTAERETPQQEHSVVLAHEVFIFMETLCWSVPQDLRYRLSDILSEHDVLMTILSPFQHPKILVHATHALAFLASMPELLNQFTSAPNDRDDQQADEDLRPLPQVEQLAIHLIDTSREGPEAQQLKQNILTLIASLSISRPDAMKVFSQSYTLIPSIILFLHHISSPLWEDDVDLMASQDQIATLLLLITRTFSLIYYMVCSPSPKVNLHSKFHMTQRPFNGLIHVCSVTFARFGFASIPEWLDAASKMRLQQLVDMGRDLVDLVTQGPDLDMMWMAFQPDPEGSRKAPVAIDHDEEEALMIYSGEE